VGSRRATGCYGATRLRSDEAAGWRERGVASRDEKAKMGLYGARLRGQESRTKRVEGNGQVPP